MPTPQDRLKIWQREQQEARQKQTAEERRRIFAQEQQGPPSEGIGGSFATGVARGALDYVVKPGVALIDALTSAAQGNFQPLSEMAERAGRGALETAAAFDPTGAAYEPTVASQAPRLEELRRSAEARQPEAVRLMEAGQRVQEARPRGLGGKMAKGAGTLLTAAAPAAVTGVLSGGSIPAIAAATALQSAAEPENLALNVGGAVIPVPVGKAVAPILKRIRGNRKISIPEVAPAIENEIEAALSQGGKIGELRVDPENLVAPIERTPVLETAAALYKSGLLTGGKTHLRNVLGTSAFQISEELARVPAVIADLAASSITNRRSISGPSLQAMARSGYQAATKGAKEAVQILKNGVSEEDLARLQLPQEIKSGSEILDAWIKGPFRALAAEDKVLNTYAFTRSIEDRARTTALNEIKQGTIPRSQYGERFRELRDSPTEAMTANAVADAEIATFNNQNLASQVIGSAREQLKKSTPGRLTNFAVDIAVPFTKTPTNILMRMFEYSPLGFGKNAFQVAKGVAKQAFTEEEQRAFSQTFGRATVGTALMALGWKLYEKGLMTGLYEDEPSKRARDIAAGRPTGAIRIGDSWYQLTGFAPLGNLLAVGASLGREYTQERTPESKSTTSAILGVLGGAAGEQPLLEGAASVLDLTKGRVSVPQEAGRMLGGFVPTAASDLAEAIDQRQREAQGFGAQIEKRVPFLRQTLPEALDVLGRPREDRPFQAVNPAPASTARELREPLIAELIRLDQGLNKLQKKAGEKPEAYKTRVQEFGNLYQTWGLELVQSVGYQDATDTQKKKALKSFAERVKVQLREQEEKGARAQRPFSRLNAGDIMRLARVEK